MGRTTSLMSYPALSSSGHKIRKSRDWNSYHRSGDTLGAVHACRYSEPGRVAQSVGHLTRKSGSWVRYPVWHYTFVSPSAFSRRAVVSYWRKYVHEVLVNRLGGLSLPRKSVVRLTDRPDMTLDVYRGRKRTMQQCNNSRYSG